MSAGGGHGPQGRYPEDVDDQEDVDDELEAVDVDDQEDVDDEPEAGRLELGDSRSEASDYECGECGDRVEYHQTTCGCGEDLMWRAPA